jgi:aminoglycoside 3-N-acetyltransferase
MNVLEQLDNVLRELLDSDERPVVIFSSAWPFFRAMGRADQVTVSRLLSIITNAVGERSLLMPAFSSGYGKGVCDLDNEPSTTGVLSEAFRCMPGNVRTLSAFFSYSIRGPAAQQVTDLMPTYAWGDHSIYHWMELQNARFLMLGTDPTHCSYIHRIEWLLRDVIRYRYIKAFDGILMRGGKTIPAREQLYVRHRTPEASNDFSPLKPILESSGMVARSVQGIPITMYDAQQVLGGVLPAMQADPLIAVVNKHDFRWVQNDY